MIVIFKDHKGWSKMMEVRDDAEEWVIFGSYFTEQPIKYKFYKTKLTEDGFPVFREGL